MKILHVLYQSFPNVSGSSTRSADLIRAQKESGLHPIVVTSPFQNGLTPNKIEFIDGIKYYRTFSGNRDELVSEASSNMYIKFKKLLRIIPFTFELFKIVKNENVHVIHAHAMFFCAIPSKIVALILKVKFIYEVRSVWEERSKSFLKRKIVRLIENFSLILSNNFIVINQNLKNEFVSRGFDAKKIFVVSNAINLDRISVPAEIGFLSKNVSSIVFGYVGSISPIEGLSNIIEVFYRLKVLGFSNKFLIFGSGIECNNLKNLILEKGLEDQVILKGSFLPNEVSVIYNQLDVVVNPRIKSNITDSVTPLKPLEALAFKKLFIGSNVGGIVDLLGGRDICLLFESDNLDSLFNKIVYCLDLNNKSELVEKIIKGHQFLINEKSWSSNSYKYIDIYNSI